MIMQLLEDSAAGGAAAIRDAASRRAESVDGGRGALLCSVCRQRITDQAHRLEIAGAHRHTFVNPGGFVHELGCWATATGCAYLGSAETAFSWFPGWSWQIADCGQCRVHIGWLFRSGANQFHGLLVHRLIPATD